MGTTSKAARRNRNRFRPHHPQDMIDAVRRLWVEKHPTREIGRRLGLTKNAVIGIANRNGFPPRASAVARKTRAETIVRLRLQGFTTKAVAQRMGMTPSAVKTIAYRHGFRSVMLRGRNTLDQSNGEVAGK